MQVKGNKGEWSEFYAFLKILTEKSLHSSDENLNLIPSSFIKVLKILKESKNNKLIYELNENKSFITIKNQTQILAEIPIIKISSKLKNILEKIKLGGSKGSFEIPEANNLMQDLKTESLKSPSSKKSDITLQIEDPITGTNPTKNYSIKSKIGGSSTLLNASQATNIRFKIKKNFSKEDKNKSLINLDSILKSEEAIMFDSISNSRFNQNLIMIDSKMPEIIGYVVKAYYMGYGPSLDKITNFIEEADPLNYNSNQKIYTYKLKQFLRAIAFGMQPSKPWNGSYEIMGGYIIVKRDGNLACFHTYDRDNFGEFLFKNTKLETASMSRHNFGKLYEINSTKYIDLNLQIRFIN